VAGAGYARSERYEELVFDVRQQQRPFDVGRIVRC
jgi:hypothetical protein